jgi:hypothetical protein
MLFYTFSNYFIFLVLLNYFIFLVLVFLKTVESNGHFTLQINSILHDGFTGHN